MPPHKRVFPYGDRLGKTSTLLLDKAAIVGRGTCGQGRGERRRRAVSSTGLRPSHGHFRRPRSANSMRLRSCGLRLSKAAGPRPSERRPYDVWHVTACLGVETTRSRASAYKTDLIPSYGGRQGLCRARGVGRPSRRRPAVDERRDFTSDVKCTGKGLSALYVYLYTRAPRRASMFQNVGHHAICGSSL